jgi:hypothetical protein
MAAWRPILVTSLRSCDKGAKTALPLRLPSPNIRPMLARVLSAALSRQSAGSATADVNGIEAFPVEVEVNSGWGETVVVMITVKFAYR